MSAKLRWSLMVVLAVAFPSSVHAQPKLPPNVRAERDQPYAETDNVRQRLDLLLPKKPADTQPLPVVVFIHGGAWLSGDRTAGWSHLGPLADSGRYAGVSVGYRLSEEAIWPAQIHDCKAAVRWIRANAKKYNFDPDRIAVMGSSAGGHLALMLGTSGDVKDLEGDLGEHDAISSRVGCIVDLWGPSELLAMSGYPSKMDHDSPTSPESRLIGGAVQENKAKARAASPITYVTADDPPLFMVHGTDDPLVPFNQSERLHAAYKAASLPSTLITVKGGGHGGFKSDYRKPARAFLDKHLRQQGEAPADQTLTEPAKKESDPVGTAAE